MTLQLVSRICICLSFFLFAATAIAVQRMGLIVGSSASIGPHGNGSLSSRCVDESDSPPSTETRYTQVLDARSPEAVVVETGDRKVPLSKAIKEGIVQISGMTELPPPGMSVPADIDELRIENLTDKEIRVVVNDSVVLGTEGQEPKGEDVLPLLDKKPDQEKLWNDQKRNEEIQSNLAELSTKSMELFSVSMSQEGGGAAIHFGGGTANVSMDEISQLKEGRQLGEDHQLSKLLNKKGKAYVYYTENLDEPGQNDADALVFAIQKSYMDKHIYRDPYSKQTGKLAAQLNAFRVSSLKDITVVIADDSFSVDDWKIVQNIDDDLKKEGFDNCQKVAKGEIKVWNGGTGKAVIVITGHIDENLSAFIDELGKAGYFKDNYIVLNTCNDPKTRPLASTVVKGYGAAGVFCYDDKIMAANVESFVLDFVKAVKNGEKKAFVDLINKYTHNFKLNGVWTISRAVLSPIVQTGANA